MIRSRISEGTTPVLTRSDRSTASRMFVWAQTICSGENVDLEIPRSRRTVQEFGLHANLAPSPAFRLGSVALASGRGDSDARFVPVDDGSDCCCRSGGLWADWLD